MSKDHSSSKSQDTDAASSIRSLPDLPAVTYDAWRQRVEESLGERSFEAALTSVHRGGLHVDPLYTAANSPATLAGAPGVTPFLGGERPWGSATAPWRIAQEYDDPRRGRVAEAIAQDLGRGVQVLWLRFDGQVRSSFTHTEGGGSGLRVVKPRHFDELLRDTAADIDVVLDAGAAAPIIMSLWAESTRRRDIPWSTLRGCAGCDPLGALAVDGRLAMPMEEAWRQMKDLALWCRHHTPGVRPLLVSTVAHHHAGATAVDEVGHALATGWSYLRHLVDAGFEVDAAAQQMLFAFAVGEDLFLEVAKLRAARSLWARLLATAGVGPEARCMRLHARTSSRGTTVRDPWANQLRATTQSFAAAAAGAWSLTTCPFDAPLGQSNDQGRRLAINTHHILAEEAHLGRVADPAAGSWYVESLTDGLARAAWQRFRELEAGGGIELALLSGRLAARLGRSADDLRLAVAHREMAIVGVSEFPNLAEEALSRQQPQAPDVEIDESSFPPGMTAARLEELAVASEETGEVDGRLTAAIVSAMGDGATATDVAQLLLGDGPVSCRRIEPIRLAQPFEELRAASERWAAANDRRPRVQLIHLGPLAEHGARASFLRNLFATAGVECISSPPCQSAEDAVSAFAGDRVDGAVLCGTDERYVEFLAEGAPALKGAGAGWLFLAGRPREHHPVWTQAGVDHFLFHGCDVLAVMETFLGDLGGWS